MSIGSADMGGVMLFDYHCVYRLHSYFDSNNLGPKSTTVCFENILILSIIDCTSQSKPKSRKISFQKGKWRLVEDRDISGEKTVIMALLDFILKTEALLICSGQLTTDLQ